MRTLIPLLFLLSSLPVGADNGHTIPIGSWEVHWSAFTGDTLSPEMARNYNLTRSGRNAVLNISVLEQEGQRKPIPASITGTATNLVGQTVQLKFREVQETGALYYLTQWTVALEENSLIRLTIRPEGAKQDFKVEFRQKFYPDHRQ